VSGAEAAGRVVVRFAAELRVAATGLVALEDYARELTRAQAASALVSEAEPPRLVGLSLDGPLVPPRGAVLEDLEAFARSLEEPAGGLGWS
jgi:hypothetical protein